MLERSKLRAPAAPVEAHARHNQIASACRHCNGQAVHWRYPDGEIEAVCVQCRKSQGIPVDLPPSPPSIPTPEPTASACNPAPRLINQNGGWAGGGSLTAPAQDFLNHGG